MQDIFNLLPNLGVDELARSFAVQSNDMMLAIYLSSLTRSVLALHNLIDNKASLAWPVNLTWGSAFLSSFFRLDSKSCLPCLCYARAGVEAAVQKCLQRTDIVFAWGSISVLWLVHHSRVLPSISSLSAPAFLHL